MNVKQQSKAMLMKTILDAGGEKSFALHGRNVTALKYLEELIAEGRLELVSREKGLVTYKIKAAQTS